MAIDESVLREMYDSADKQLDHAVEQQNQSAATFYLGQKQLLNYLLEEYE